MAKKIPLVSIGVKRDGKSIFPEIGKPFDFTKEELADLDKMTAVTKIDYYRNPVNEDAAPAKEKGGKGNNAPAADGAGAPADGAAGL